LFKEIEEELKKDSYEMNEAENQFRLQSISSLSEEYQNCFTKLAAAKAITKRPHTKSQSEVIEKKEER